MVHDKVQSRDVSKTLLEDNQQNKVRGGGLRIGDERDSLISHGFQVYKRIIYCAF